VDAVATIIAGIAVVVAVSTFVLTYRASLQAERRGRTPVLVLLPSESGWHVENSGPGAALNIVIAQGYRIGADGGMIELDGDRARRGGGVAPGEVWCNPIHLRPLAAAQRQSIPWDFKTCGVGIRYTDIEGFWYTVRTSGLGTQVIPKKEGLPIWSTNVVELHQLEHLGNSDRRAMERDPWGVQAGESRSVSRSDLAQALGQR